jgi:vacuolar-type H+-ATPase subunit H
MTRPEGIPAAQAERLLEVIETHRSQGCGEVLGQAREEARRLVRQAFREAHQRLHEGVQEQRVRSQEAVNDALARLQTRRRAWEQETLRRLLDLGWQEVRHALERRWQDSAARRLWCTGLLDQARHALFTTGHPWRVHHPTDWAEADRESLCIACSAYGGPTPLFAEDRTIAAGLRIEADGAVLDGTLEGLLYDRTAVEAMILAELEET